MSRTVRVLPLILAACVLFGFTGMRGVAQSSDPDNDTHVTKELKKTFEREDRDDDEGYVKKRQQWFHDQRAYPLKKIPGGIRERAIRQRDAKVALQMASRGRFSSAVKAAGVKANVTQPQWTSIGTNTINFWANGVAGRVPTLAINPTNPQIIYAGGAEGGVWKTTDGGSTWTPLTDNQASLATGAIALDPNNPNTVYVGTGEESFSGDSYYGAGILKSTDGGTTWTHVCGPFCGPENVNGYQDAGAWIGAMAVSPSNSKIVLAAVELWGAHGIYRSADGGNTWALQTTDGGIGTAVFFEPQNGNIAYAASTTAGVLKSTDGGVTWTATNGTGATSLPAPNGGRVALAMAPSNPLVLYVGIADNSSGGLLGAYKTADGGNTWTQLTNITNYCGGQCWYDNVVAVQPTNPNVVVFGGDMNYGPGNSAALISQDGGNTFLDQSNGLHPDSHALIFTPDGSTLYMGNDGGVFVSTSFLQTTANTATWSSLNATMAITEPYPGLSVDPGNVNHTYMGTQDNGTQKYTGGSNWVYASCGDGGQTAIDFTNTQNIYTNCIEETIYKSTDDGATFNPVTNGLVSERTNWVPPLVMDPENAQTLYFGTYRVYQSTDGAGTWTPISGDLTSGGTLNVVAVAPTDSNTVYSGSGDGRLFLTRNASAGSAASWTDIGSSTQLPNRSVDWIAVDPTTPTTAYAAFSGFTGFGDSLGHVFKTTTAGASWTDISSDLPNTPADAILVDPDNPATLFLGTDIGAFYTTSGGASWSVLGTGLPNVVVVGLALHNGSRTLRASTHGRSVWDLNIASLLPVPSITSTSPTSASIGEGQFTLTVNGVQFDSKSVVQWNGTALTTTFVSATQVTAVVPASDVLAAGTASITVFNADTSSLSNAWSFPIDNVAPTLTSVTPNSVVVGGANFTLTATGSNFVNGATVNWNGSARTTTFVSSTTLTATILSSDIASKGTATVTVSNPAPGGGTSDGVSVAINNPAPTLTSLSPNNVKAGNTSFLLSVNGKNFVSGANILWNGTALSTTFNGSTQVQASVPAADVATAGSAAVTVTNPAPGGGTSSALTFTINNPVPVGSKLTPATALAGGSAFTLTVTGSSFVKTSEVKWAGVVVPTSYVSATEVTAAIPATDIVKAGTVVVTVFNPTPGGGTTANMTFTVDNPVPTLSKLSQTTAVAGGAAFKLTVTGTNYNAASVIKWAGTALTTTYISATSLSAVVPASDIATAGTAAVTVFSPTPGGGTSGSQTLTIDNPVPTVSKLTPATAITGGASFTLTVTGANFEKKSTVRWNGNTLTTTYISPTSVSAVIPASDLAKAATVPVSVTNQAPGGGSSSVIDFIVDNPLPTTTSVSPTSALMGSANLPLTVNGTNFVATSEILWNGATLTTTYVSSTKLTTTVPAAQLAKAGTATVSVKSPTPGGGTSGTVTFTIDNPVPGALTLSPSSATAGSASFSLVVTGTNFVAASVVKWNGTALTTFYESATSLKATVPVADVKTAGTAQVTVTNPTPGGGTSSAAIFTISAAAPPK